MVDTLPREQWRDPAHAEVCLPVWRAALRAWARDETETRLEILAFLVAFLGEFAGPDFLEDLWELADMQDTGLFLHANWALWRMGQRFPAEMLASLLAAIPDARPSLRCGMAEHLSLMHGMEGVEAALLELVKDFPQLSKDVNASYLLVAVADALTQTGHPERAAELFAKYERLLDKEGRRWVRETLDSADGFVPRFVGEGLLDLDIEDVCLSHALIAEDDGRHHDFDDDEFEEEDDLDEPEAALPKPGRNEPCWCGSGKKYKKCHLDADEEAARAPVTKVDDGNESIRAEAMAGLLATAERLHKRRDQLAAARQYFGGEVELSEMEMESENFFTWYPSISARNPPAAPPLRSIFASTSSACLLKCGPCSSRGGIPATACSR